MNNYYLFDMAHFRYKKKLKKTNNDDNNNTEHANEKKLLNMPTILVLGWAQFFLNNGTDVSLHYHINRNSLTNIVVVTN